jgi:hypothetical protein
MKHGWLVAIAISMLGLPSLASAQSVLVPVPGTPAAGAPNPGGSSIIYVEGGGVGVQPIIDTAFSPDPYSVTAGDVVILSDSAGGDAPSNFAAVIDFFNPADPTGALGLAGTEYETYYGGNAGAGLFSSLPLSANTIYAPQGSVVAAPGDLDGLYYQFGPAGGIEAGQEALLVFLAAPQPPAPTVSTVPEPSTWLLMILGVAMCGAVLRRKWGLQRVNGL